MSINQINNFVGCFVHARRVISKRLTYLHRALIVSQGQPLQNPTATTAPYRSRSIPNVCLTIAANSWSLSIAWRLTHSSSVIEARY